MLKIVSALLMVISLISSSLWSMSDPNTNKEEIGITLGEIIEHIEASTTYINPKPIIEKLSLWSLISVAIPGACPGILLAGLSCDNYFRPFIIQFNSSKLLCPFGLGTCAVPVAMGLTTLGTYTTLKIINYFYRKNTLQKQQQLSPLFSGREREIVATYDDILGLGYSFFTSNNILSKLNTAQALALAEANFAEFKKVVNNFSGDATIYGNKLLRLLSMDLHALSANLNNTEATAHFLKQPALWQALVRALPENIRSHRQIKKPLTDVLRQILQVMQRNYKNVDGIFNQIVNHEVSFDLISHGDIIILDLDKENDVELDLVTDGGVLKVSRSNLRRVSHYFEQVLDSTTEQQTHIDVRSLQITKKHLQLAIDIATKKYPEISENNVLEILHAAQVMQIPWAFQECDKFLETHNLFEQVFSKSRDAKNGDVSEKLLFCKKYQLKKNRKHLLYHMNEQLYKISNTDHLNKLNDLQCVDEEDFKFFSTTQKFLKENLAQDYFLIAISNYSNVPFVRKLLADYFATKSEVDCAFILEKIYMVPPSDLVKAIDQARKFTKK